MTKVVSLDARRPHVTITTHAGVPHVLPAGAFVAIAKGVATADSLPARDALLRVIVAEWLEYIGLHGAAELREMKVSDGPA